MMLVKEPSFPLYKPESGEKMKYCYIFNYTDGELLRINIPDNIYNNFQLEEYLEDKYGFKMSNIEYMTTPNVIQIKILKDENC